MNKALVILIYGLGGGAHTWGEFPRFLRNNPAIAARYDVADPYVYTTSLLGDGPDIDQLALELDTFLEAPERHSYTRIVLICYSMGGLVAKRYVADQLIGRRRLRATRLLTYATPHLGSGWANTLPGVRGPQIQDLAIGSKFMNRLGFDWVATEADRHIITHQVVAGDDAVVGQWSSTAGYRYVGFDVLGGKGHFDFVKIRAENEVLQIAERLLLQEEPIRHAVPGADWRNQSFTSSMRHPRPRIGFCLAQGSIP